MLGVFGVKHMDTRAEARGGAAGDLNPLLTNGRVFAEQRGTASLSTINQGARGHQNQPPTPQDLIRQVTGVGDPARGR